MGKVDDICFDSKIPGQILITSETMRATGDRFTAQQLPPIQVKGKQQPVNVFQVTGYAGAR